MKTIVLLLCVIATSLTAFVGDVYACTCGEITVAERKRNAKAVFLGTVLSKKKSDAIEKNGVEVTLKVERVWKGDISERVVVYTGATDDLYDFVDLCASWLRVGQKHVVFTYGKDKHMTDVCAGTGDFPYAEEVIRQLGKGKRPRRLKS